MTKRFPSLSLFLRSYCFSLEMHYGDSIFPALSLPSFLFSLFLMSVVVLTLFLSRGFCLSVRCLPPPITPSSVRCSRMTARRRRRIAGGGGGETLHCTRTLKYLTFAHFCTSPSRTSIAQFPSAFQEYLPSMSKCDTFPPFQHWIFFLASGLV